MTTVYGSLFLFRNKYNILRNIFEMIIWKTFHILILVHQAKPYKMQLCMKEQKINHIQDRKKGWRGYVRII